MEIKICGLADAAAVEAAVAGGADMIGLVVFPPSPRHVDLADAARLAALARGRAAVVALTVDADDALLCAIVEAVAPDAIQLHGSEAAARVAAVRERFARPVIRAVGIGGAEDLGRIAEAAAVADRVLLDARPPRDATRPGGHGALFDWSLLAGLDPKVPFMLSGGLTPENVAEAVRIARPAGLDVSSGVERAPGVKDPDRIRAFLAAARAAA